ncbi:hypothetical protein [Flavobacterium nackdongense]|uniref:Uncharacterized protein n=1 Tax=Flavobacterium nackdongense TaxID=2547394 RepID=A0A4P6YAX7_9FLAO|nr:hypothetical protein [Flavobacterium nackdongense]QBN17914.1 hypothetical protein E1750_03555 [Flavobacterium nackdongense]
MDKRLDSITDKWNEANYHYFRLKKYGILFDEGHEEEYITKKKYLMNFRYELNSFVNSSRSVTFIIQKVFKNKFEGFDEWYQEIQETLKSNKFAKIVLNLRNKNQKEGNFYPQLVTYSKINNDFSFKRIESVISVGKQIDIRIPDNIVSYEIITDIDFNDLDITLEYDNSNDTSLDEIRKGMIDLAIREYHKEVILRKQNLTEDDMKNMKFKKYTLVLGEGSEYSISQVIEECEENLNFLKKTIFEAKSKFLNTE